MAIPCFSARVVRVTALLLVFLLGAVGAGEAGDGRKWTSLRHDNLHDPNGPAIDELQSPSEALSLLPADTAGNLVLWVKALRDGIITPRTNILPDTEIRVLDMDIVFTETGDRKYVLFPHKPHTEWLDCENCHDRIFKTKYGATNMGMMEILQGEFCGQCHGAVSFPLTECDRCHSLVPANFKGKAGVQPSATGNNTTKISTGKADARKK